ncbi:MAG TPA: hypothetical protein VJ885_11135, partial [Thermoanaerobaculia bacterium]|nr:hypothetical protein [Thermoanaerobaculia bacterium]
MAKTIADTENSTTGHERANENLRELLDRGGSSANIGNGTSEPGDPAGTSNQPTKPMESVS